MLDGPIVPKNKYSPDFLISKIIRWNNVRKYILVDEGSAGQAAAEEILNFMLRSAEASGLCWPAAPSEIITLAQEAGRLGGGWEEAGSRLTAGNTVK